MIIDFFQKKESVEISYVNDNGNIEVEEIFLEPNSPNGFFDIVITSDTDPDKLTYLESFYGQPVKKVPSKYFRKMCVNEFLNHTLESIKPKVHEKAMKLIQPNLFAFDIEIEITDEFGYSTPEKAENRVISISVTNDSLNTLLFIVDNPNHSLKDFSTNPSDKGYIENHLRNAIGDYYQKGGINENEDIEYNIKVFDTEFDMLTTFIESINKYFHVLFGWNSFDYDWKYIMNRCEKLGIDIKKASPTRSLSSEKSGQNLALNIPIAYPRHRLLLDYMKIFKASVMYTNMDSFSLNNVSSKLLNIGKVSYQGNLKTLYEEDYLKFVSYAFVDTILTMLLHKVTNLLSVFFFQASYVSIPFTYLNQNPISFGLIYNHNRKKGKFMTTGEFTQNIDREYEGAFVKTPTKHISEALIGLDFASLYPNSMISYYLSPDTKVADSIQMKDGRPADKYNQEKFDKYIKAHHAITPLGRIYAADPDNLVTSIEKSLLEERKFYKKIKNDIYLNIIPKIKEALDKHVAPTADKS